MATENKFEEKLEQILKADPEMQQVYTLVSSLLEDGESEETEFECIEIDGKEYIIIKEFVVKGTTYVHLINENDPLDMMYRKVVVEDGEEFLVGLDSDSEFDLVVAYEQKYIWKDIKRRQELNNLSDAE